MHAVKIALINELMGSRYANPNRREERLIAQLTADQILRRYGALVTIDNAPEFAAAAA